MANMNFKGRREKKSVVDDKLCRQWLHALPQKERIQWRFQWHSERGILGNERSCTCHLKGADASYILIQLYIYIYIYKSIVKWLKTKILNCYKHAFLFFTMTILLLSGKFKGNLVFHIYIYKVKYQITLT
jgi:hypothetical protein